MANDSNLLKEAIADAKAVRRTALLNAKVALEEAFSERYQKMFAEKLKEDTAMDGMNPQAGEEEGMNTEETVSESEIDALIKELEAEVGGEQPPADPSAAPGGMPPAGAAPGGMPPMGAAPTAPPMGGEMGAVQGAIPGSTVSPVPPAMPTAPGVPPAPPMGAPAAGSPPPSDVPPTAEEEDVNLDELLESLKEEIEDEEEDEKKLDEQTKLASSAIGGSKAGGSANKKPTSAASSTSKVETAANDDEGMPTLDQAKVVAKEATQASRPNKATHATKDNLSTPGMGSGKGSGGNTETGYDTIGNAKVTSKEATNATRPNQAKNATATNLSTPGGMLEENATLKNQLSEAYETITYVKGQLNEINLLNAKLLYTNKLFKEFSMNNEQKMRIVEMFDLSKNIREVKLTYANIAESLNFSGVDMKRKAQPSTSVQSITEGLSSKPVGSTKPNRGIITESRSAMVTKFQKLAGIQHKV